MIIRETRMSGGSNVQGVVAAGFVGGWGGVGAGAGHGRGGPGGQTAAHIVGRAEGGPCDRERVRAPYGPDLYLGLPEALEPRYVAVQPMLLTPQQAELVANKPDPHSLTGIAFNLNATPPTDLLDFANTRAVRALGSASAGGV